MVSCMCLTRPGITERHQSELARVWGLLNGNLPPFLHLEHLLCTSGCVEWNSDVVGSGIVELSGVGGRGLN